MSDRSVIHAASDGDPAAEIRALLDRQDRAIRSSDADAVMALYAEGVVSFDVVPPLRSHGAGPVRQRLEAWLDAYDGEIGIERRELVVEVSGDVAFCHGLQRITGTLSGGTAVDMWVRVTTGFRSAGGAWRIVHQHLSEPFDPQSGRALTELEP